MTTTTPPPQNLPSPNNFNQSEIKQDVSKSTSQLTAPPSWDQQPPWGTKIPPATIKDPGQTSRILALFSYLGPLILIPILMGKGRFIKFHLKQGFILLGCWVVYVLASILIARIEFIDWLYVPFSVLSFGAIGILAVIGVMNAVNGYQNSLPVVGRLIK